MSTRANIIVKDGYDSSLIFYRHSDGYPKGTLPSLKKFVNSVKNGPLRNNISQACGALILIGACEYDSLPDFKKDKEGDLKFDSIEFKGWKCGAYEPTTGIHGDIEHLYLIDLKRCTIEELEIPEEQDWAKSKVIELHYTAK